MGEGNQERNIMILFLSTVHYFKYTEFKDAKILGKGDPYSVCGATSVNCIETNEAPLKDIRVFLGKPLDAIFYFATKAVRNLPTKKNKNPSEVPIKIYLHENDHEAKKFISDEDFFWTILAPRMLGENYHQDTKLIPVPYDEEDADPIQSSIFAATEMKEAIKKYLGNVPVSGCHFFADITGGLRPANMAMSAVMQLLQYEGAKLERVVYSDLDFKKVSDMQPINDLYQLVAGVDAFTKYGRSDAIEDYFDFEYLKDGKENHGLTSLEKLLAIMHRFADAMSLCWPDHIIKALNDLIEALDQYPDNSNDPREKLLIQLLPTIREKYDSLRFKEGEREGEIDRLAVIKWCVDNNLIQPALTFCTEWLPKYIVDYGAVYADDPAVQAYCKAQKKDGDKETNGKKFFVMDFFTKQPTENVGKGKTALKKISNCGTKIVIDDLIDSKGADETDVQIDMGILPNFLRSVPQRLHNVQNGTLSLNKEELQKKKDRLFVNILEAIVQSRGQAFCRNNVLEITDAEVFAQMKLYDLNYFRENFYVGSLREYPYRNVDIPEDMDISDKGKEICGGVLRCGMVKTIFAPPGERPNFEKAMKYIQQYTNIRSNIRNTSLHAANTKNTKKKIPQTFSEVKKDLEECLEFMVELVNDERAKVHKVKNVWPDAPKKEEATP